MDIRHSGRPRTFEENDRPVGTSSEDGGLPEQSPVDEREREIGVRLPLNDHPAVDAVISDLETLHPDLEVWALLDEIAERGIPLGTVHANLMTSLWLATALVCSCWRMWEHIGPADDIGIG